MGNLILTVLFAFNDCFNYLQSFQTCRCVKVMLNPTFTQANDVNLVSFGTEATKRIVLSVQ